MSYQKPSLLKIVGKRIYLPAILCALLMTFPSCSKDAVDTPENITFSLSAPATRGTVITTATLTAFGVSCGIYPSAQSYTTNAIGNYFHNIQAQPSVATAYGWPTGSKRAAFYAHYPYGNAALTITTAASGTPLPTYSYTVPQAIASQVDVMTAQATDVSCAAKAVVPLTFRHRLADIRLVAHNKGHEAIILTSVTVTGLKYAGTLTGDTWTPTGSANTTSVYPFTLTSGTSIAADADLDVTGTTNHLMMIPQVIPASTLTFTVNTVEDSEPQEYSYTFDSSVTFQMGKSYTFTMNVGNGSLVVSELSDAVDWDAIDVADVDAGATNWGAADGITPTTTITDPSAGTTTGGVGAGISDWSN